MWQWAGLVEYCILRWRGPVLVLEDPRVGWYMEVRDLHMSCGLEFPTGFLIGSNRRCSSVMKTQLTVHHRSLITGTRVRFGKEFDMKFMISLRIMADSYVVLMMF